MAFVLVLILQVAALHAVLAHSTQVEDASSFHKNLVGRDNRYRLKCSNAPTVVAGNFFHYSDMPVPPRDHRLTTAPPLSGSDEPFMDYLWCTVNTATYTFFGVGTVNPQPTEYYDIYGALNEAIDSLSSYLSHSSDGALASGNWTLRPDSTNIEIYVQNSKGTMTYGVLQSALQGLSEVVFGYVHEKKTMVFQINDGKWGEMGIGYVGFLDASHSKCAYDIDGDDWMPCEDVRQGLVIK